MSGTIFIVLFGAVTIPTYIGGIGRLKQMHTEVYENRVVGRCNYSDSPKQMVDFDFARSEIDMVFLKGRVAIMTVKGLRYNVITASAAQAQQSAQIINQR